MKALTLTQPWATLVAIGAKRIETRDWSSRYRGPLAIHAAKGFPDGARAVVGRIPFLEALNAAGIHRWDQMPLGAIVATAVLRDVFRFHYATRDDVIASSRAGKFPPHESSFGDYAAGRYGFVLESVRKLDMPIACRGALGLWNLPPDVEAAVLHQRVA